MICSLVFEAGFDPLGRDRARPKEIRGVRAVAPERALRTISAMYLGGQRSGPGVAPVTPPEVRTYAGAGVDSRAKAVALGELLKAIRYRPPASSGRPLPIRGHFAGLTRIGRETIAVTTDTVGSKVLVADQMGRWDTVGEDVVAVNVNDLAAVGARPAGFVDVISCRRPDATVFRQIGTGMDRAIRVARCALLGGETATVPDLVQNLDLGGTAFGFFPGQRRPVTGRGVRPGDVLVGLPSAGFHANGFTLVRKLIAAHQVDLHIRRPGSSVALGEELLLPTRIYVPATEALAEGSGTTGFAHITGGGVRNLIRLNPNVSFVLDRWPSPEGLFYWTAELGRIPNAELYQTFNMGIGFVVALRAAALTRALRRLARVGFPDARPVGHVERGTGVHLPTLGLDYARYE